MNDRVFLRNFPWIPYMIFLFPQLPLLWCSWLHIYVVLLVSAFGCICSQSQEVWKEHRAPDCGVSTLSCHITLPVYKWLLHCHQGFHRTVASSFYHMELKLINYFMALQSLYLISVWTCHRDDRSKRAYFYFWNTNIKFWEESCQFDGKRSYMACSY